MKTIFITSFHAHISRNILLTDAFSSLKANNDMRIVLLVPDYKTDYFKKNFGAENIFIEGVSLYASSKHSKNGLFFKRVAEVFMPSQTRVLKQRYKFYTDRKIPNLLFFWAGNLFGRSFFVRKIVRYFDFKLSPEGLYYDLFDKYKPDAIFSCDLHNENDVSLIQDAKRKGIPVIGMFRSWDNPTQSILRVFPDKFLAGSQAIAEETATWQGYPKEKIILTGHPHYDKYLNGPTKTKANFFAEFGLDPKKKLVLFTPLGDKFLKNNDIDQYTLEVLKKLPTNKIQILVRFPPDEPLTIKKFVKPSNMIFHQPGFIFSQKSFEDREMRPADDESLINSIYWSDIVITGPTSINLDATFFDKPIIAANLIPPASPAGGSPRHYFETDYCFDFSHIQKFLGTGAASYVETEKDLLDQINKYLEDPAIDTEGRAFARAAWFSAADGRSCKRVIDEIYRFIPGYKPKVLLVLRQEKNLYYVKSIIKNIDNIDIIYEPKDAKSVLIYTRALLSYRKLLISGLEGYFLKRFKKYLILNRYRIKPPDWLIRTEFCRQLCLFADWVYGVDEAFLEEVRSHNPDVVMIVAGGLQRGSLDIDYLKAAKALSLKTAVLAMSWDSLTTKGLVQLVPDIMFCWNKLHYKEALAHGIPEDRIMVVGAPAFDYLFEPRTPRENKYGDYVLFLGSPKTVAKDDSGIAKSLKTPFKVIVRGHPMSDSLYEGIEVVKRSLPDTEEAISDYYDQLYYAKAVVAINTSAMAEAVILNKPVTAIIREEYKDTQSNAPYFISMMEAGAFYVNEISFIPNPNAKKFVNEYIGRGDAGAKVAEALKQLCSHK